MSKLNPHSNLASFYRYFYLRETLPNNLCNYFWGLVFAFSCFPFVWIAMLINRYKKIISYDETPVNIFEYYEDEKGCNKSKIIGTKKKDEYEVQRFSQTPTGYGFAFTFFAILIGVLTSGLSLKAGYDFSFMHSFSLPLFFVKLYLLGVFSAIIVIILFILIVELHVFLYSFKKELTLEELLLREEKKTIKMNKRWEKERNREVNPNFLTLTWRWIVAFKEKNCPIITWDYDNDNNTNKKNK